MKKVLKCLIIVLIINLIFSFSIVNALSIPKIKGGATSFIHKASGNYDASIAPVITSMSSLMLGIGVIAAIITGLVIAIKVMTDGAFGKAQLKEALTPYLIGLIVLFSAGAIWAMVVNVLQNN